MKSVRRIRTHLALWLELAGGEDGHDEERHERCYSQTQSVHEVALCGQESKHHAQYDSQTSTSPLLSRPVARRRRCSYTSLLVKEERWPLSRRSNRVNVLNFAFQISITCNSVLYLVSTIPTPTYTAMPKPEPTPYVSTSSSAIDDEQSAVHDVYDAIAPHFSQTRHKVGP
jgi:hypothetical protein